jgi:hypothetical protein
MKTMLLGTLPSEGLLISPPVGPEEEASLSLHAAYDVLYPAVP